MAYYSKKNERDGISIVKLAFFSSFTFHVTVSLFPSLLDLSFYRKWPPRVHFVVPIYCNKSLKMRRDLVNRDLFLIQFLACDSV